MSEGGASDVVGIDSLIFSEYQLEPCEVAACAHKDGFNTPLVLSHRFLMDSDLKVRLQYNEIMTLS